MIILRDVTRTYRLGSRQVRALDRVTLTVAEGEFVAVVGPSGSGKSTLLHVISGIDRPESGEVLVAGTAIAQRSENDLARWRGQTVGIVFQFFQLLPTLTAVENVALPMELRGDSGGDYRNRARRLLAQVGMSARVDHLPSELSGGEQQRVAIARAIANRPSLLLADEPTGNLDADSGAEVLSLIRQLHSRGMTVVLVTHDPRIAAQAERVVHIFNGRIVERH
ncbi:MAG: ABC transporter ATP-binding protein [Chloroflexi bacterium]|nr:ABC transporter ATP-binding protein [Chloroflexota bacterium]